ncbi:MAG TPA: hypothetical protein VN939_10980 [Chthoniobacterales bacterium]|jgi:hypothetical protein|nr:hypothetical protein [Chthoniobacterales bacterium]
MHVDRVYFGNFLNENWMIKVAIYAATIFTGATLLYLFIEGLFLWLRERIISSLPAQKPVAMAAPGLAES